MSELPKPISTPSGNSNPIISQANTSSSNPGDSSGSGGGRLYGKELRCMMYGFGDDQNPYTESVELLEDVVLKYINDVTRKAMDVGRTGKITVDDIMFLIRKDRRKCRRVEKLLEMNEELKKSRKAFDIEILATQNK